MHSPVAANTNEKRTIPRMMQAIFYLWKKVYQIHIFLNFLKMFKKYIYMYTERKLLLIVAIS